MRCFILLRQVNIGRTVLECRLRRAILFVGCSRVRKWIRVRTKSNKRRTLTYRPIVSRTPSRYAPSHDNKR
jgi:hypothetical protein